jgi:hypothetical protein
MKFDDIGSVLIGIWNFLVFILASILFLPALLIVNLLQGFWTKQLGELFGL